MKKRTSVSIKPRFYLSANDVSDRLSHVCSDLEDQMFGPAGIQSVFVDRPEHNGANDHLMNAVDMWEDQNGWKRQGW